MKQVSCIYTRLDFALMFEDGEPAYDLGWTSHPTEDVDAPGESMDHQADGPAADNIDNDDGPAYDLGWGESTSVNPGCPDVVKAPSDDDASTYDLGSGDAPASPEVIDLTSDDGPTYDLGWDMRPSSPLSPLDLSSGLLSPTPPSPGAMGVDIKVERASSLDGEFSHHTHTHMAEPQQMQMNTVLMRS